MSKSPRLLVSENSLDISQQYAQEPTEGTNEVYRPEDIVYYILYTYALIQKRRKEQGVTIDTMSRQEYQDNKPDDFPDYWVIRSLVGGWGNIRRILPIDHHDQDIRNRKADDCGINSFYNILVKVAQHFDTTPVKVEVKQFSEYKANNPEENIANWKTYAKHISHDGTWSDTKNTAIAEMGRRAIFGND